MAEIKIDLEAAREVGWLFGTMANAFIQGFKEGFDDFEFIKAEEETNEVHETGEETSRPAVKTEISDCRACWCDQCAKLEKCKRMREGAVPDGIRPSPCIGCENGMRFKPCEAERCDEFEQGEGFNNG